MTDDLFKKIEDSSNDEEWKLSEEAKTQLTARCKAPGSPPSLKELCELVIGPGVDGRDKRAKLIKEFCSQFGIKLRLSYQYHKQTEEITFTEDQQAFIKAHCAEMNATEIARILWSDQDIGNLDKRARAVRMFVEANTNSKYALPENDEIPDKEYQPPTNMGQASFRVNKYVRNAISSEQLEKDTRVKKNLECLISYCHNPRFLSLINAFDTKRDRMLFESCFIRYLYTVGEDLSQVDLDGYISLCLEVVNRTNLQKELERLNKMRDQSLNEDRRLSMSIVEMIGKIHAAIDDTEKRQNQLRQSLEGNRSKRIEQRLQSNHSVSQLVEAWRQDEKRKRMIRIADKRREMLKNEIVRLDNLDELKIEIFGLDPEAY